MFACTISKYIIIIRIFSSVRSIWEREADLHLATTNKFIHGGPRVHDGKYRHWSHVLLWGGYVQSRVPDLVFESYTPADPLDDPCTTLGHLRGPSLLCRTLQSSRRITLIYSIHLPVIPIISFVELIFSQRLELSPRRAVLTSHVPVG